MARFSIIMMWILTTGCWSNPAFSNMLSLDDGEEELVNESLLLAALGISHLADDGNTGTTSGSSTLKYAYFGSGSNVAMFSADDATGILTALSPAMISSGNNTWNVVADPKGQFLYAPYSFNVHH